jgi:GNAT superfamily N-acetyltransferase
MNGFTSNDRSCNLLDGTSPLIAARLMTSNTSDLGASTPLPEGGKSLRVPVHTTVSEGYVPGCIGRIAQLHADYYGAANGFGVDFEAKVARELADFCQDYKPGRDGIWLALCNGDIEGSVAIDGTDAQRTGAHLRWFITSNEIRGQGIGKKLLEQAMVFVRARGYRNTYLWTFAGLDAARHLYESHRFRLAHESPGRQWGTLVTEQRFERNEA